MHFTNRDINLLAVHTTLHKFAWGGSGVFIGVYLYRGGIPLATIFLAFAAIYIVRFLLRPLVLVVAPAIGIRATLILGTLLHAAQYPALALVHGIGLDFVLFCGVTAIGWVFYWTCYHAVFSALGDAERRGSQVGARQVLGSVAAVLGPALGGIMLTAFGPWAAFGAAALVEASAVAPLFWISDPPIEPVAPEGAYAASKAGMRLFATDGWILGASVMAWTIIMFQALDARFDVLGGLLAVSAFAGAIGGAVLGRFIDLGHTRNALWINGGVIAVILAAKSICGNDPIVVAIVAVGATLFGGLYTPSLMIALYNEAKASPCPLRFQFAAEGGWDLGALCSCLAAAGLLALGAPLQATIALAIPMIPVQAWLLDRSYGQRRPAIIGAQSVAAVRESV
jgi:MFS transporter, DHA1 family, inner membrane transport protein